MRFSKIEPATQIQGQGNDQQEVVLISAALCLPVFNLKKRIPHIVVRSFIKNPRYFQKTKCRRSTDLLRQYGVYETGQYLRYLASLCNERQSLSTQYNVLVGRNEVQLAITYIYLKMESRLQLNGLNDPTDKGTNLFQSAAIP